MRRNAKVDQNQPEIVAALRNIGAFVKHTHQLKNAFDILVGYRGSVFIIEIKTDEKKKLTKGEQECKEGFDRVGVPYHVVCSVDEAINLVTKTTPKCKP